MATTTAPGCCWVVLFKIGSGLSGSETDLTEDSLVRQQFGSQANYEAHHCEATIPSVSDVAEAESRLS